jgi:glycine/D-amino acid oxidase-like deaminating enzyme
VLDAGSNGDAPVIVIGGGAIGLCTAFYLRQAGVPVTVVERAAIGAGASWGNAGWVCLSHSAPLPAPGVAWYAARSFGRGDSPLYVKPRPSLAFLAWLVAFQRSCTRAAFEHGYFAMARFNQQTLDLYDELHAAGISSGLRRLGIVHAFLSQEEGRRHLDLQRAMAWLGYSVPANVERGARALALDPALSAPVAAAYLVTGEGVLDPSRFITSLGVRLRERGVTINESTSVTAFHREGSRVTAVLAGEEMLSCSAVVVAAGVWSAELVRGLGIRLPLQAGNGYSFSIALDPAPEHSLYLREKRIAVSPIGDVTRLAGTMELNGNNRKLDWSRIAAIAHGSRHYLGRWYDSPEELSTRIRDPWVGGRPLLPDGLPVVDALPTADNVYLATGHGTLGITLAPATGRAMADFLLTGKRPEVVEPFRLDRFGRAVAA